MFDPYSNMKMALALMRRRFENGEDPYLDWGAYTNGSYKDHIGKTRQDLDTWKKRSTRYQNRDNYRDDVSLEDSQRLGAIDDSPASAPVLVYKTDRIGPTSTGFHLDTKRVDRKYFDITELMIILVNLTVNVFLCLKPLRQVASTKQEKAAAITCRIRSWTSSIY